MIFVPVVEVIFYLAFAGAVGILVHLLVPPTPVPDEEDPRA